MNKIKIDMRADQLQAMHEVIRNANDEELYLIWIYHVPDEPSREDFETIAADDEEYKEVFDLFISLICNPDYRV